MGSSPSLAHSDSIWGVAWTAADTVISLSADGSIKQWSASQGQPHPPNSQFPPKHTLGLVSLSVSPDGGRAIYNSIEGLTSLWDLSTGDVVAKYESYARTTDEAEPCKNYWPSATVSHHYSILAWSVSLNPKGETYASCGGSGNVFVHSAQASNFGEILSTLSSGRHKFGMHCSHVRILASLI